MVCPYSLTIPGGVQQQVLGLSRSLRSKGVDVHVLAPCDGPPPEAGITSLGASLPTAANGSIAPIAPDLPAQLRLVRAIWDEKFDVLHLHEPLAPGVGITTVLMQAAPMVGTFHAAGQSSAYRIVNRGCRALRRRIAIGCAVSADAEALASRWLGGTYERVFNGIEFDRFALAQPEPTSTPTVLFLGRHEQRKGLRVLLEAFPFVGLDAQLWIAGDGDETDTLRREFGRLERVTWLGRIDEAEKLRRLAGADVFCAPSLGGESFGIVLLEAMAAGTPVVASSIDGYRKVARNGEDALLVPAGDAQALAVALKATLHGDTSVAQRVKSGHDRARSFSMDSLANLYIEKYERALQR